MGLDRFIALMAGEPDIRLVIAFPKVSSGGDPLRGAPTPMPDSVLKELGLRSIVEPEA
jgi:aspartyl-tRNA synthetase